MALEFMDYMEEQSWWISSAWWFGGHPPHQCNTMSDSSIRNSNTKAHPPPPRPKALYLPLLALITLLSLSPSAYADRCTPTFNLIPGEDFLGEPFTVTDDEGESSSSTQYMNDSLSSSSSVMVKEGDAFEMKCELDRFHSVKWTINNRELTDKMQDEWGMNIQTNQVRGGFISTTLLVFNASTTFHAGEYKCTPVCLYDSPGANQGVKVTVTIAINVTVNSNISGGKEGGIPVFKIFVAREKKVEIICTAHVPDASMSWYRKIDGKPEQVMDEVCGVPDVELSDRKKPPEHCRVIRDKGSDNRSILKLEIKRARKEGNETLKTIPDFRQYVCRVTKEGNQGGAAIVELIERVSVTRNFDRGEKSLTVTQGDTLKIYCDVHGIDQKEFIRGDSRIEWTKDGKRLEFEDGRGPKAIGEIALKEKGKPYRLGYLFELAETDHRGYYTCEVKRDGQINQDMGSGSGEAFPQFTFYVRVKDKLGALWPFLAICGEVVILCTIILIYEKRRHKAELEESDTDKEPVSND